MGNFIPKDILVNKLKDGKMIVEFYPDAVVGSIGKPSYVLECRDCKVCTVDGRTMKGLIKSGKVSVEPSSRYDEIYWVWSK